jgi:hypothetical protein
MSIRFGLLLAGAAWLLSDSSAFAQTFTPRDASTAMTGVRPSDIIYQKLDTSKTVAPISTIQSVQGGSRRNLSSIFERLTLGIFGTTTKVKTGVSQFPTQTFPQNNSVLQPQRPILPTQQ